jgi:fatty acid desaturase
LHRLLVGELAAAGCFRPAPLRSAAYGAFIVGGYAGAYAALLSQPGAAVRFAAIVALAFLSVHAGFLAHEAGHGALTPTARPARAIFNTLHRALLSYFSHSCTIRTATIARAIPTCSRSSSACTRSRRAKSGASAS